MPGEKGAQPGRQPGEARYPGGGQYHEQHGEGEQLPQAAVGHLRETAAAAASGRRRAPPRLQARRRPPPPGRRVSPTRSGPAASAEASARNGTKARSWKRSMLKASRPWVRLSSARSVSWCRRMAVELMASAPPTTIAAGQGMPPSRASTENAAAVAATCAEPRPNTSRRMAIRRGRANSRPSVKRRNTTPSSARRSVVAVLSTTASA